MISPECFGAGMTVLEARFGPVTKQALARADDMVKSLYRQALNERLTDDSFTTAITNVIATARFFPTPAEIIEAGIGTPRDIALREWNELVEYRAEPNRPISMPISEAGLYAAKSVGGVRFVCDAMQQASRAIVRKDFIESYELALKMGKSSQAAPVPTLAEGREPERIPEIDPAGRERLAKMVNELLVGKLL